MSTTIQLDTLQFSDYATTGWVFEDLTDWYGLSSDKSGTDERAQAHGAFEVATALRSSKAVSFKAHYLGLTERDMLQAVEEISAIGAEGRVRMYVTDELRSSYRWVNVVNCAPEDHHGEPQVTVTIDVLARDPRRYMDGAWTTTGPTTTGAGMAFPTMFPTVWPGGGNAGRITLHNDGRTSSSPQFILRGGFTSALITCAETGGRLGFSRDLSTLDYLLIDVKSKRALLNGDPRVDFTRWVQFREWEDVPARSTRTYQLDTTGASGSPTLEGKVDSAWL